MSDNVSRAKPKTIMLQTSGVNTPQILGMRYLPSKANFAVADVQRGVELLDALDMGENLLRFWKCDALDQLPDEAVVQWAEKGDHDISRIQRKKNVGAFFTEEVRDEYLRPTNGFKPLSQSHFELVIPAWVQRINATQVRTEKLEIDLLDFAAQHGLGYNRFRFVVSTLKRVFFASDGEKKLTEKEVDTLKQWDCYVSFKKLCSLWNVTIPKDEREHVAIHTERRLIKVGELATINLADIAKKRIDELGLGEDDYASVEIFISTARPPADENDDDGD